MIPMVAGGNRCRRLTRKATPRWLFSFACQSPPRRYNVRWKLSLSQIRRTFYEPPYRRILIFAATDKGPIFVDARLAGYLDAIFVFAMSAEWFDNGLIVRHLANETISAKGSQPYRKAGSGVGPRRPAPASFLP